MNNADLEQVRSRLAVLERAWQPVDIVRVLRELGMVVSDALVLDTVEALRCGSTGLGPLEPLLGLPGLTDILVNGPDQVFIDRGSGLESAPVVFADDDEVRHLATRLATGVGRRLDDAVPFVDARLASGIRFHAVLAPLAEPGTCISLRIPPVTSLGLEDWVAGGGLHPELVPVMRGLVDSRRAFVISGGTGAGKTTLMATLLTLVPTGERLVIVEDSRELRPAHPHCVCLEGRQANAEGVGAIPMTALVRQALRMRPDRLVVGEVRGAEICDFLTALNTGHEGGCGTIHANSVAGVPARMEALAALGGMERAALHAQVAAAFSVVIQVVRGGGGRRVSQIGVFGQREDGLVTVKPAASVDEQGSLTLGPAWSRLTELVAVP